jgi:hypothetical protein
MLEVNCRMYVYIVWSLNEEIDNNIYNSNQIILDYRLKMTLRIKNKRYASTGRRNVGRSSRSWKDQYPWWRNKSDNSVTAGGDDVMKIRMEYYQTLFV